MLEFNCHEVLSTTYSYVLSSFFHFAIPSCITWRLNNKEVIIVIQKMSGRKGLQQPAGNSQQPSAPRPSGIVGAPPPSTTNMANTGAVPWQSVVLGENVAYVKELAHPPPSYEEAKAGKKEKSDPEYDYVDSVRGLTVSTSKV